MFILAIVVFFMGLALPDALICSSPDPQRLAFHIAFCTGPMYTCILETTECLRSTAACRESGTDASLLPAVTPEKIRVVARRLETNVVVAQPPSDGIAACANKL